MHVKSSCKVCGKCLLACLPFPLPLRQVQAAFERRLAEAAAAAQAALEAALAGARQEAAVQLAATEGRVRKEAAEAQARHVHMHRPLPTVHLCCTLVEKKHAFLPKYKNVETAACYFFSRSDASMLHHRVCQAMALQKMVYNPSPLPAHTHDHAIPHLWHTPLSSPFLLAGWSGSARRRRR